MTAARGDRKPCTHRGCPGTMQFGREPLPWSPSAMTVDGERGWICTDHPEHFVFASHGREPVDSTAPDACWDDHAPRT